MLTEISARRTIANELHRQHQRRRAIAIIAELIAIIAELIALGVMFIGVAIVITAFVLGVLVVSGL